MIDGDSKRSGPSSTSSSLPLSSSLLSSGVTGGDITITRLPSFDDHPGDGHVADASSLSSLPSSTTSTSAVHVNNDGISNDEKKTLPPVNDSKDSDDTNSNNNNNSTIKNKTINRRYIRAILPEWTTREVMAVTELAEMSASDIDDDDEDGDNNDNKDNNTNDEINTGSKIDHLASSVAASSSKKVRYEQPPKKLALSSSQHQRQQQKPHRDDDKKGKKPTITVGPTTAVRGGSRDTAAIDNNNDIDDDTNPFEDKIFALTGTLPFLRKDVIATIEKYGGTFSKDVTSKVLNQSIHSIITISYSHPPSPLHIRVI
jgi:hypothetical protein